MRMDTSIWLDYNHAAEPCVLPERDAAKLRMALLDRLEAVLQERFPHGRVRGNQFTVGDVQGAPGKSLVVELAGERRGLWKDFATDEGGDVLDLWARSGGGDVRVDFPRILEEIRQWLGVASAAPALQHQAMPVVPMDELGPYTAKWDYFSVAGELLACVYRYDPPGGKEFRPWDVRARLWRAPAPRPLYNLPAVAKAREIVLVEGEKCADALIRAGFTATTAMHGAKAPVDKTDWTPLAGKSILIWPDRDAPGWAYAENIARACVAAGCASVAILLPPADKPTKWDAADAVEEGFDCNTFMAHADRRVVKAAKPLLPTFTLGELLDDDTPLPDDLIAPRVLTPGGMAVFGGAPKVGKSDFLLSWLTHMAAGAPFLGMRPPRPLRVFYLQAEVQYHYLRERVKDLSIPSHRLLDARRNFVSTPQLRFILDEAGLAQIIPAIRNAFDGKPPDIIAIDPIRNVFDGGEGGGGENDNGAMLYFLSQRVEQIRQAVHPDAGIILVHHTKKLGKKQFEEDPFQALAGAGSLRGYYSTGMLLFRPDETRTVRQLHFELRNGAAIPQKQIDKINGEWQEVAANERMIMQDYGKRLDAERRRKRDVILQILFDEAGQGRCYTANQFAEGFEGKAGLGGERTIRERLSALSTQGYIKYFRNGTDYGLPPARTKFGYLCVEGMLLRLAINEHGLDTQKTPLRERIVLPTHFKCPQSGATLPVENPEIWIYQDDINDTQEPA